MGAFDGLSDEVILMILTRLSPQDLYSVMRTCRRLRNLCLEEKLWISVENLPDLRDDVEFALNKLLNPRTRRVSLRGVLHPKNKGYRASLSPSSLHTLRMKSGALTELHLVNQRLDAKYFRLQDLPENLLVLNLRGSVVSNVGEHDPYLKDLGQKLVRLEELDLSYCNFVTAHSLMSISKLPNLRKLMMRGCRKIGECLAYVALASRFGFSKLQILDVCDTTCGSSEFTSLAGISTLEEFYLGQYDAFVEQNSNSITDLCLTRIRNSKTLKCLDISGSRVTDRIFEIFESIPNLQKVEAHFTSLSREGIDAFHQLKPNCRVHVEENPVEIPLPPHPSRNMNLFWQGQGDGEGSVIIIQHFNNLHRRPHRE